MLAHSFFIESSSKLLVTNAGIKARTSSTSGLWFPWPIYMFFEMRGCQVQKIWGFFNTCLIGKSDVAAHNSPRPFGFISLISSALP